MPNSCTSLELDTHANDDRTNDCHESLSHLCIALRQILSRMQHVRLRIGAMCPSMFGTGHAERMQIDGTEYPFLRLTEHVPLSNIETLVINCGSCQVGDNAVFVRQCGVYTKGKTSTSMPDRSDNLYPSMLVALEVLLAKRSIRSPDTRIVVSSEATHRIVSGSDAICGRRT